MESLSPNMFVKDIDATIEFYRLLGFEVVNSVPDGKGGIQWAMMSCGSATFMFQTFESLQGLHPTISRADGGSLLFYIKLKGIRAFFERLRGKVTMLTGLEKTFYGATEFSIRDNNNFMLTFGEDE